MDMWNSSQTEHDQRDRFEVKSEENSSKASQAKVNQRKPIILRGLYKPNFQEKIEAPSFDPEDLVPEWGPKNGLPDPPVYLTEKDYNKKTKEHQTKFLMERRQIVALERKQVREKIQSKKHKAQTARMKAEKERLRFKKEQQLTKVQKLIETKQWIHEREIQILEQLKTEEQEKLSELMRLRKKRREKESGRYIEALQTRMKAQLGNSSTELPLLCCCASTFWDTHPDTCANSCVFYKNPKGYIQALESVLIQFSLE